MQSEINTTHNADGRRRKRKARYLSRTQAKSKLSLSHSLRRLDHSAIVPEFADRWRCTNIAGCLSSETPYAIVGHFFSQMRKNGGRTVVTISVLVNVTVYSLGLLEIWVLLEL